MTEAWQILRDCGLPMATASSGQRHGTAALGEATRAAIAEAPRGREAEALAAFVFAWSHHWPQSFADALGGDADSALAWAERHAIDADRYLKLRRIALENLAQVI
jgi:hypothetical protein